MVCRECIFTLMGWLYGSSMTWKDQVDTGKQPSMEELQFSFSFFGMTFVVVLFEVSCEAFELCIE